MESNELKQLVSKIFGDKETREEFIKDPNSVIARFSLTEQEKKAVLSTHARLGLVNGDSIQLEETIGPSVMWF
jgi:hypothetical protein